MSKLYGEGDHQADLELEDLNEFEELKEQLDFLDQWDLEESIKKTPVSESNQQDILSLQELADYLQLNETEVVSLLPEIPHVFLAGKYRFQLESVKVWLSSIEQNSKSQQNKHESKSNIVNFQDFLVRNVI